MAALWGTDETSICEVESDIMRGAGERPQGAKKDPDVASVPQLENPKTEKFRESFRTSSPKLCFPEDIVELKKKLPKFTEKKSHFKR